MGQIITRQNRKILEGKKNNQKKEKPCCKKKENCPLKEVGKSCATENVIYKAYVKTKDDTKTYKLHRTHF